MGIVFIVNFALVSLTGISICGSCDIHGNSWSPLSASFPASSTINSVTVDLSATDMARLVICFLCCGLGCRCWPSFVVGSCSPLVDCVVSALAAFCRILVASLWRRAINPTFPLRTPPIVVGWRMHSHTKNTSAHLWPGRWSHHDRGDSFYS